MTEWITSNVTFWWVVAIGYSFVFVCIGVALFAEHKANQIPDDLPSTEEMVGELRDILKRARRDDGD